VSKPKCGGGWCEPVSADRPSPAGKRSHVGSDETLCGSIRLDEAIKYTPRGGRVRLALRSTATHALFEVMDSGVGITPEDLPQIFERFYRASNARYANSDGSGLGLATAQWVAAGHCGTLEAIVPPAQFG
jgi:light-regulated signal transduction histidine kinase (bacteriophytochrome)